MDDDDRDELEDCAGLYTFELAVSQALKSRMKTFFVENLVDASVRLSIWIFLLIVVHEFWQLIGRNVLCVKLSSNCFFLACILLLAIAQLPAKLAASPYLARHLLTIIFVSKIKLSQCRTRASHQRVSACLVVIEIGLYMQWRRWVSRCTESALLYRIT